MFENILQCDRELLLAMNFDGGPVLDTIMSYSSAILTWMPLYIVMLVMIWRRFGWKYTLLAVAAIVLAVAAADQICNLFKNGIPKLRPTRTPELEGLLHLVAKPGGEAMYRGGLYGTVSAHAATTFSIAVISSCILRRRWFTVMMIFWAALVSYSRVYVAVHYPLDIFFGALLGVALGLLFYWLLSKITKGRKQLSVNS